MQVVYYLMTHKNQRQIERLVAHLRSTGNAFVIIHHDPKYASLTLPPSDDLCLIDNPVDVQWGRISVVHAMWRGIEWLERSRIPFDWMIFLSGADYPARPLPQIEATLRQSKVDAYVHHELIPEDPALHQRYFHTLCMRRYFFRRIKIPGLRPWYLKRQHPYTGEFQCFAGSQWLNLSHRAVQYLWERKKLVAKLIEYLSTASCPDETVFQTVLMNNSTLKVENSNMRFIEWMDDGNSPEILCQEHLGLILASNAWFARKLDDTICPQLLDRLDDIVSIRTSAA